MPRKHSANLVQRAAARRLIYRLEVGLAALDTATECLVAELHIARDQLQLASLPQPQAQVRRSRIAKQK